MDKKIESLRRNRSYVTEEFFRTQSPSGLGKWHTQKYIWFIIFPYSKYSWFIKGQ